MLRNIVSVVLNRSLLNTPRPSLRITDTAPSLYSCCRLYSLDIKTDKVRRPEPDDGIPTDTDKLGFITKHGLSSNIFPDEKTMDILYDGVPYNHLPFLVVKSSKNNTKFAFHDHRGRLIAHSTSGHEGFKLSKKGTGVAAYVTSVAFGRRTKKLGATNLRLVVNGYGKGRESVLKGFLQVGLNIVSVTDSTAATYNCPRPKKVRRV